MADAQPPELWWSPSLAASTPWSMEGGTAGLCLVWRAEGEIRSVDFQTVGEWNNRPDGLPDDAVLLVPAEPVDEKGRTPTYLRGFEDGRMAGCAGAGAASSYLSAYARVAIDHRAAERAGER